MKVRLALLLCVALLAACNSGGPEPVAGEDATTDASDAPFGGAAAGDLTFTLFGDTVETAGYQQLIDAFMADHEDITITLSPVATQDDLLAKLATGFAGGQPPDVFLINYRRYGQFASQDVLAPVQPYLDASEVIAEDEFVDTAMDPFRYDGETLTCMPQNVSSLQVYYNVDLFEEEGLEAPQPGWTWDDFLAAAKALTKDGRYGVGIEPTLIKIAPFVWSAGGELVDDQADPTTLALDTPEARAGVDFFLDLQLEHGVVPPQREELSLESEARFLNGELGMYFNSRRVVPTLRTITDFTWDVAPVPVAPGGEPATILHGDAYCMAEAGPAKDAAWAFIEFANSEEGQTILAESGRTVPSRKDVAASPAFLEPDKPPASSKVFIDTADTIRPVPVIPNWSRVEDEGDTILAEIFYGQVDREDGLAQLIEATAPLFATP